MNGSLSKTIHLSLCSLPLLQWLETQAQMEPLSPSLWAGSEVTQGLCPVVKDSTETGVFLNMRLEAEVMGHRLYFPIMSYIVCGREKGYRIKWLYKVIAKYLWRQQDWGKASWGSWGCRVWFGAMERSCKGLKKKKKEFGGEEWAIGSGKRKALLKQKLSMTRKVTKENRLGGIRWLRYCDL